MNQKTLYHDGMLFHCEYVLMASKTEQIFNALGEGARDYREIRNNRLFHANQKDVRYFTRAESIEYLGINGKTIDSYIMQSGIDPKRHDHSIWAITIDEMYTLRDLLPEKIRVAPKFTRSNKKLQVITIQNQKGGVGKTVSAVTIASGLATQFHQQYRVGLIDLDGQGTASMYYVANTDDTLTAGDLIRKDYDLDDGETEHDAISESFLPTAIPNLRILPAAQHDRAVDGWFHKAIVNGLENPYKLLDNIINEVENEFDIIIIDTPPSLSFVTLNAYYAASSVIFPLGASENDLDATCGYFEYIKDVWDLMESNGHQGYDFTRLLLTNYREDPASIDIQSKIEKFFPDMMYSTEFHYSVAIRECSALMSTVFDMSKSEYPKTKQTFNRAATNAYSVINKIHSDIVKVWSNE